MAEHIAAPVLELARRRGDEAVIFCKVRGVVLARADASPRKGRRGSVSSSRHFSRRSHAPAFQPAPPALGAVRAAARLIRRPAAARAPPRRAAPARPTSSTGGSPPWCAPPPLTPASLPSFPGHPSAPPSRASRSRLDSFRPALHPPPAAAGGGPPQRAPRGGRRPRRDCRGEYRRLPRVPPGRGRRGGRRRAP